MSVLIHMISEYTKNSQLFREDLLALKRAYALA